MEEKLKKPAFRRAFRATLPVMFGYIPLGMAFGLLLSDAGYGLEAALGMSALVYAGSAQFLAVMLFSAGAGLAEIFLTTLFLNIRHMVYGLSMLERFRGMGWARIYLVFGLTDEAYALYVGAEPGKGENEKTYLLWVCAFCHFYWILGSVLGAALGRLVTVNTTGMDFSLTALFIVLAMDLWDRYRAFEPFLLGAVFGVLARVLLGEQAMMPGAIVGILGWLMIFRKHMEARLDAGVRRMGEGAK